jgi:hypothetical protein
MVAGQTNTVSRSQNIGSRCLAPLLTFKLRSVKQFGYQLIFG